MKNYSEQININNQKIISKRLSSDQMKIIDTESENYAKEGQLTKIQDNNVLSKELKKKIEGFIKEMEVLKTKEINLRKEQEKEEVFSPNYISLNEQIEKNKKIIDSMHNLIEAINEEVIDIEAENIGLMENN